jgi:probable rRNA maturation factor
MLHAMIIIDPEAKRSSKGRAGAEFALSALRPFLRRARQAVPVPGQVSVLLASDSAIKRLNGRFRGIHRATDVISFPALDLPAHKSSSRHQPAHTAVAGDLAISFDTAARQALRFGHPLSVELKILLLHGMLHLAGYDHETDAGEMGRREEQLRRRFRLPNSLIARSTAKDIPARELKAKTTPRKSGPRKIARTRRAGRP